MKCYRRCFGTLAGTEGDSSDSRVGGPAFNGNKWVWIQRDPLRVGHFDATGARETRSEFLKCEMLELEACVTNVTLSRRSRDKERSVMSEDRGRMWLFRSKILLEIGERSNGGKFNQVLRSPARTWRKWKTKMTSTDQTLLNKSKWSSCLCRSTTKRS